jgi:hypothetical protein
MSKNSDVKTSKMPGGTIKTAFGMDNTRGMDTPNDTGISMGGSTTNLSHSLTGASAVQKSK